jgi:hypothetical protein
MHIDLDIIKPLVSCQYIWNMRYVDDPAIKGDVEIVARGAVNLAVKEQVNMRRIEFLNATANEIDMQIIEPAGRAAILREVAKGLEMPVDEIVPSREKVEAKVKAQAQAEQMAAQQPQEQIDFQRDGQGNMTGASIRKPNNGRPEGAVMDQGPAARTAP